MIVDIFDGAKLESCEYGGKQPLISEKAMAPHSSTPAQKIPWMEEPDRRQSMGSLRVGHDCATSLSLFIFMHWRRKWQPTPVFLPGESQGRGSLVGCPLWVHTESDTTEVTQQQQPLILMVLLQDLRKVMRNFIVRWKVMKSVYSQILILFQSFTLF